MGRAHTPGRRSKTRYLAMNEADSDEFSVLLRQHFTDIRFPDAKYWRLDGRGSSPLRQPPNLQVPYRESLGFPRQRWFLVWREPPGWKPFWLGPDGDGCYFIINKPALHFYFDRGATFPPHHDNFSMGRMWAYYDADDPEHLAFLNKVWRLSQKLTTNVFNFVDRDTRELRHAKGRAAVWAGRHTLQWCREDPRRVIASDLRPAE